MQILHRASVLSLTVITGVFCCLIQSPTTYAQEIYSDDVQRVLNRSPHLGMDFYSTAFALNRSEGMSLEDYSEISAKSTQGRADYNQQFSDVKKPLKAIFLATFPGFFVHGLGHRYAGDATTFKILYISEIVAVPIMLFSLPAAIRPEPNDKDSDPFLIAFKTCAAIFLTAWAYDIIVSPIKAHLHNRQTVKVALAAGACQNSSSLVAKIQYDF